MFEDYLNSLSYGSHERDEAKNVWSFSLAPYEDWLVATVTFHHEPYEFTKCRPNHTVRLNLPRQFGRAKVVVDCDFIGITPLYSHTDAEVDIIAVSGLASHPFGSWRSRIYSDMMWLRDLLPQDLRCSRVFIWGYDSNLCDGITTHSIMDFSRHFLMAVHSTRNKDETV